MAVEQELAMKREAFLSNPAFLRFVRNWEIYQQQLQDITSQGGDDVETKTRMHSLYPEREMSPMTAEQRERYAKMKSIQAQIFEDCETNNFSKEKLASIIIESGIADTFLTIWNPKPGENSELGNHVLVNRAVAYELGGNDTISLHIKATPVKNTPELLGEILDGFNKVGELLRDKFKDVKEINMESWLLGKGFADKIATIFGDNVHLKDVPDDLGVQILALQYNSRSLSNYLKDGSLPPIRRLTLSREQFIEKFGG